jgi:hypothetical protein
MAAWILQTKWFKTNKMLRQRAEESGHQSAEFTHLQNVNDH